MADQINTEEERAKALADLDAILQFLYGAEELDGVWFGSHPIGKPQFWWRSKLREAVKGALLSASQPVAGQGWMPIETAPHNERVLVYSEGLDEVTIGWQDRIDGKWYFAPQGGVIPWVLTGWRRLYEGAALSQPKLASGWASIERGGMPPCDGETVYVGINSAGFACCFNEVTRDGVCSMTGPEISTVQMSGLRYWRALDRPDVAALSQPSAGTAGVADAVVGATGADWGLVGYFMEDGGRWLKMDNIYADDPDAVPLYRKLSPSPCAEGERGTANQEGGK